MSGTGRCARFWPWIRSGTTARSSRPKWRSDRLPLRGSSHFAREAEPEAGQSVGRLHADATTAELDEPLHDGEPDPRAAPRAIARLVHAVEALEDARQVGRRDAVTCVRDAHEHLAGPAPSAHRDTSV